MSYTLYSVEGIILSSTLVSESSSILFVLTEEMGLIRIWAQGVRKVNSKLAPHIQDMTQARLVVIKGREYWRLTDAEKRKGYTVLLKNKEVRSLIVRIIQMVNRFAHEGVEADVFTMTQTVLNNLEKNSYSKGEVVAIENLFMLRLFHILGYGKHEYDALFYDVTCWNRNIIDLTVQNKRNLIQSINNSLKETQL